MEGVDFSPDGTYSRIGIQWSEFYKISDYPILSVEEAVKEINLGNGAPILHEQIPSEIQGCVTSAKLCYSNRYTGSGYLQPIYEMKIKGNDGKEYKIHLQAIRPEYIRAKSPKQDESKIPVKEKVNPLPLTGTDKNNIVTVKKGNK